MKYGWLLLATLLLSACQTEPTPQVTRTPIPRVRATQADPTVVKAVLEGKAYVNAWALERSLRAESARRLLREDVEWLGRAAATLAAPEEWPATQSRLSLYYDGLIGRAWTWQSIQGHRFRLRRWGEKSPDSKPQKVAMAAAHADWAQEVRYEHKDWNRPGSPGYQQYRWYADEALRLGEKIDAADSPYAAGVLAELELMREEPDLGRARRQIEETLKRDPLCSSAFGAESMVFWTLRYRQLPNWSDDEAYTRLFLRCAWMPQIKRDPFVNSPWKYDRLLAGYRKLLEAQPDSLYLNNSLARTASFAGDEETARKQFERIGENWEPLVWGTREEFDKHRTAAGGPNVIPATVPLGPEADLLDLTSRELQKWQLLGLLEQERYLELEEVAEHFRLHDRERLRWLYDAVSGDTQELNKREFEERRALLERWKKEVPDSATARVALGEFWIGYAWYARGSGYADSVTDEGWKRFGERIELADSLLDEAERLGCKDASLFNARLITERAGQGRRERAEESVRQSLAAEPKAIRPYTLMATFLLPRWHGEDGDILRFVRDEIKVTGDRGVAVPVALAVFDYEGREMFQSGHPCHIPWDLVKQGFDDLVRGKRLDMKQRNRYAQLAVRNQDRKEAARALAGIPESEWDQDIWDLSDNIKAARAWAVNKGPNPFQELKVELVSSGIYEMRKEGPVLLEKTDRIPCRKGVTFGMLYRVVQRPAGHFRVNVAYGHPSFRLPNGRTEEVQTVPFDQWPGDEFPGYAMFTLEYAYELEPGEWNFQLQGWDDEVYLEVPFQVVEP
ncbi:MAG: DUF3859 domain-containing protein [Candidatus Eremiobacterota bacterium]